MSVRTNTFLKVLMVCIVSICSGLATAVLMLTYGNKSKAPMRFVKSPVGISDSFETTSTGMTVYETIGEWKIIKWNGHQYVQWIDRACGATVGSITHDPDCPCLTTRKTIEQESEDQ